MDDSIELHNKIRAWLLIRSRQNIIIPSYRDTLYEQLSKKYDALCKLHLYDGQLKYGVWMFSESESIQLGLIFLLRSIELRCYEENPVTMYFSIPDCIVVFQSCEPIWKVGGTTTHQYGTMGKTEEDCMKSIYSFLMANTSTHDPSTWKEGIILHSAAGKQKRFQLSSALCQQRRRRKDENRIMSDITDVDLIQEFSTMLLKQEQQQEL